MKKIQLSPMMKHYLEMKEKYKDAILMYRLGDFYEMFFEDAEVASKQLELTLTGRDCGLENRAPMCGVPYHAVDTYISRLVNRGFKVAICEQLSNPGDQAGMVDRDVVRVITAGTLIDDGMLDERQSNYIVSVFLEDDMLGIAWAEMSTGEFNLHQVAAAQYSVVLENFFNTVNPSEIIANGKMCEVMDKIPCIKTGRFPKMQAYYDWAFNVANAEKSLLKQLKVGTLAAFECEDKPYAISAAGSLMEYLVETQKRALTQFCKLSYFNDNSYMVLDANTRRNLELTETIRDRKKVGSLLWVLDKTCTNMGARNLRKWLDYPILEDKEINNRLDAVGYFYNNGVLRKGLQEVLSGVADLERLSGKCAYGNVTPSDMLAISETLTLMPKLKSLLKNSNCALIEELQNNIDPNSAICSMLNGALEPKGCTALFREGGFIKKGYNAQLDEYKNAKELGQSWLAALEATEKEETGIRTLKINYNKVFGYYIEVSNSFVDSVPFRYCRKQTLVNAERYTTDELKKIEDKLMGAQEKALQMELDIFDGFKKILLDAVPSLSATARAIANIDTILSLAKAAMQNGYVRPNIGEKIKKIDIKDGRHPVVEVMLGRKNFVSNDAKLDGADCRTMVITGPNMAGKSTFMRQVALITLLAHIGSYVPAASADISITDRIFTRVGASDDVSYGQSTFMVEMVEVATIINNATAQSLLILDEIGRGTSTYDGLSIAWAVMEYVSEKIQAKTLFATHYHELTELEGRLAGVKNYRILVNEIDNNVVFLHKITRGGANKSFGIEVASLAGVPSEVTARARQIAEQLELSANDKDTNSILMSKLADTKKMKQVSLFADENNKVILDILRDTDINNCSPMQAFNVLSDLIERAKK